MGLRLAALRAAGAPLLLEQDTSIFFEAAVEAPLLVIKISDISRVEGFTLL